MLQAILQRARGAAASAAKRGLVLPTVYLAAIALPLLLTVVAIGLRISAAVATRIDAVVEPGPAAKAAPASVTALPAPRVHELASLPQVVAPLPAAPAPVEVGVVDGIDDAPRRGPLQLVDESAPSTKHCPDCAETVLASARVCKHCHFRFEPPLRGSYAV